MALYSFANGLSLNASKLLCRARYIVLTCCGENHPQISLIDVRMKFKNYWSLFSVIEQSRFDFTILWWLWKCIEIYGEIFRIK